MKHFLTSVLPACALILVLVPRVMAQDHQHKHPEADSAKVMPMEHEGVMDMEQMRGMMHRMMQMHKHMMGNPEMHDRMMADPEMKRMMEEMRKHMGSIMGSEHQMGEAMRGDHKMEGSIPNHDAGLLEAVLEDVRLGWETGSGAPFYEHFLDWDGARYFEGGGQNEGLQDLVEHHVEPEAELGLRLGFSNIETHFEGKFAWAVVDTEIQLTTTGGREIHNRGHGTYLFRWVDGAWKVVHTQSGSSPVRP